MPIVRRRGAGVYRSASSIPAAAAATSVDTIIICLHCWLIADGPHRL